MKNLHKALIGLAVVQVALLAVTWRTGTVDAPRGTTTVVDIDADLIDRVTIVAAGTPDVRLDLRRTDDGWVIASAGDFPAEADLTSTLISNLRKLNVSGEPIATNPINHAGLNVSERSFTRRVEVHGDGRSVTFWLGAADGGGLNLRRDGEDAVYVGRGATLFNFGAAASNLVKRELLELDPSQLDALVIENPNGGVELRRVGGQWRPDAVPVGRVVDSEAVDRLVSAATVVRFAEPTVAPADAFAGAVTRLSWSGGADGDEAGGSLEIGAEVDSNRYVRRAGSEHTVLVSSFSLRAIVEASPTTLSEEEEPPPEQP